MTGWLVNGAALAVMVFLIWITWNVADGRGRAIGRRQGYEDGLNEGRRQHAECHATLQAVIDLAQWEQEMGR